MLLSNKQTDKNNPITNEKVSGNGKILAQSVITSQFTLNHKYRSIHKRKHENHFELIVFRSDFI